jgi:mRNA interferase RelE/StbE
VSYRTSIRRSAQRTLEALPEHVYRRVAAALRGLSGDPRPPGCTRLTGRPGWRIRVGDYRVIYEIDDTHRTVTVLHIGHRRDAYR